MVGRAEAFRAGALAADSEQPQQGDDAEACLSLPHDRGAKAATAAIISAGRVGIVVSPGGVPTSLPYSCTGPEKVE